MDDDLDLARQRLRDFIIAAGGSAYLYDDFDELFVELMRLGYDVVCTLTTGGEGPGRITTHLPEALVFEAREATGE